MKKAHNFSLAILLVIICSLVASFMVATAKSETFLLVESGSVSRIVDVNAGDRIVGSYSVSNIPSWRDSYTGDPKTLQYSFKIAKIESPTDIVIFEVKQNEQSNFDVFCQYTGNYILRFNVGTGDPSTQGIGDAQATLSYQVIKPTTIPTQNNGATTIGLIHFDPVSVGGIIILITMIAILTFFLRRSKAKANNKSLKERASSCN